MHSDYIGQSNILHPSYEIEMEHYGFHSLFPLILVNFTCLLVIRLLLFQLPLMLALQDTAAMNMMNVIRLGASFHEQEHEHGKLEVLCHMFRNLIPTVRHPPAN